MKDPTQPQRVDVELTQKPKHSRTAWVLLWIVAGAFALWLFQFLKGHH